jgi:hypothetical protein
MYRRHLRQGIACIRHFLCPQSFHCQARCSCLPKFCCRSDVCKLHTSGLHIGLRSATRCATVGCRQTTDMTQSRVLAGNLELCAPTSELITSPEYKNFFFSLYYRDGAIVKPPPPKKHRLSPGQYGFVRIHSKRVFHWKDPKVLKAG